MRTNFRNLAEIKENFPDADIKEVNRREVGMSYELRTQIDYELMQVGKTKVTYQNTKVYLLDGKTLVCESGEFKGN
jgi:hypothetical protein